MKVYLNLTNPHHNKYKFVLVILQIKFLRLIINFSKGFATATVEEITSLLDHAVHMRPGTDLHHRLMRVLPFLTYTNQSNMGLLINHFDGVLNFTKVSLMPKLSFRQIEFL